jgi:biopolymer transport protein TolR
MGIAVGETKRNGSRHRPGHERVMSEINVTPLVDVMLVLLIIFMITAPLLTVGVPVDLPKTKAQAVQEDTEPLAITITIDGKIYLQDTQVSLEELVPRLTAIAGTGYDQRIFVRGDKGVEYGRVMEVMGLISGAGFKRLALITDQELKPVPG